MGVITALEFHLRKGKAIFILKRALPLEHFKIIWKVLKGHQGQDQGQQRSLLGKVRGLNNFGEFLNMFDALECFLGQVFT